MAWPRRPNQVFLSFSRCSGVGHAFFGTIHPVLFLSFRPLLRGREVIRVFVRGLTNEWLKVGCVARVRKELALRRAIHPSAPQVVTAISCTILRSQYCHRLLVLRTLQNSGECCWEPITPVFPICQDCFESISAPFIVPHSRRTALYKQICSDETTEAWAHSLSAIEYTLTIAPCKYPGFLVKVRRICWDCFWWIERMKSCRLWRGTYCQCIHAITQQDHCATVTHSLPVLYSAGGFSYVYLVKELDHSGSAPNTQSSQNDSAATTARTTGTSNGSSGRTTASGNPLMVLKVTSIHSRQQRDIAEKEAKLLSRLSHPSIIKMFDSSYRTTTTSVGVVASIVGSSKEKDAPSNSKERPQHLILMEYCEGGHALDVCNKLAAAGQRFDLSALIIAFGQICNAVSYLHAQRPPIVHRDLKPVNFLVKNGAYKLCDFGSAVFGHVELKTQRARVEAEEVIQKTTTQMFRAPEMVDLYMAKRLTQRFVNKKCGLQVLRKVHFS